MQRLEVGRSVLAESAPTDIYNQPSCGAASFVPPSSSGRHMLAGGSKPVAEVRRRSFPFLFALKFENSPKQWEVSVVLVAVWQNLHHFLQSAYKLSLFLFHCSFQKALPMHFSRANSNQLAWTKCFPLEKERKISPSAKALIV